MTSQLDLLDFVRVRRTDPETSRLAAEKAKFAASKRVRAILLFLEDIHPDAATPDRIGRAVNLDHVQVDRLRKPMVDNGLVEIVGQARMSNGNLAGTWRRKGAA